MSSFYLFVSAAKFTLKSLISIPLVSLTSFLKDFNWNGIAKNCSHPHLDKNRINLHTIDRQKEQLKNAGIYLKYKPDWNYLRYKVNKFNIDKPYAILVPGGSKHRKNKRWNFNNFLEIIKYLKITHYVAI